MERIRHSTMNMDSKRLRIRVPPSRKDQPFTTGIPPANRHRHSQKGNGTAGTRCAIPLLGMAMPVCGRDPGGEGLIFT